MPNLAEIKRQIAAIPNRYIFWTQKEIRSLPEILTEHEQIRAITSGLMEGKTWLAVCTQTRLVFLNRGMFFGLRQFQVPLNRVVAIDHEYKLVFGTIRIWDGASYFTLQMVLKASIDPFVRTVQECVEAVRPRPMQPTPSAAPAKKDATLELAENLQRLADLRDRGVLTQEEFEAQKKKLLG